MKRTPLRFFLPAVFILCAAAAPASSAEKPASQYSQNARPEWQWSVAVAHLDPSKDLNPRAYLWIPPGCKRLRGVVVGQQNMQEEQIFENQIFRRALAELDFGLIWVTPAYDLFFRFDRGSGEKFDAMLQALAEESGYSELTRVPVIPIGHSAAASAPWNFGAWAPERTLAAISVSGQWAYYKDQNTPEWGGRIVDTVPGLVTMGEYEGAYKRADVGLAERAANPEFPLSMLAEPGGEHFAATDAKVALIADYLRAAAKHRLPEDWPVDQAPRLREIDPTKTGWLVDRGRPEGKPAAPAAPVGEYKGNPAEAFWAFDGDLAKKIEALQTAPGGRKNQFVGYVQKDGVVAQRKSHVRVNLRVEIENDGMTFKLGSELLDQAPADWGDFKAGDPVEHSADASKLTITRTIGPVEKIGPDTFALRFTRGILDQPRGSTAMGFLLSHPGDDRFKPAALESEIKIWKANADGQPQEITGFNLPSTAVAGGPPIPLSAKSSAGLPVHFFVREGPAVVEGDSLRFTGIPPRAKLPVKVTVVAWQWGRAVDPKVQSAAPVEKTILLNR